MDSQQSSLTAPFIHLHGVRQNNLKGFDLSLPTGKLIAICGPSGSGKSSLAFDTLYAEGQRRYVETFSPYTRQFFDRMDKPAVDDIQGIPPAIAIEQVNHIKSTRSTVGTMTDLNDYLKLLLPRVVDSFCPRCQSPVRQHTASSLTEALLQLSHDPKTPVLLTFPLAVPPHLDPTEFLSLLQQQGFQRYWVDGSLYRTDQPSAPPLPSTIYVVQDRLALCTSARARISEAVEAALHFGKGKLSVIFDGNPPVSFASGRHCASCALDLPEPSSGRFSFNHPLGACSDCRGFGRVITLDLMRAIPDPSLSLAKGAIKPFQTESGQECQADLLRCAQKRGIPTHLPFAKLSEDHRHWVLYGEASGASWEDLWRNGLWYGVKGFFDWLEARSYKMHVRVLLSRYRSYTLCPACQGGRFAPDTLLFRWAGRTAPELMRMPVSELHTFVSEQRRLLAPDPSRDLLLAEVESRLAYLLQVGLGYLSLERPSRSLSGGETARVNLTTCLGTSLVGTLFVLDEPSIGLHPRDTSRLVRVLEKLRDAGNTVLVVEHEELVLRAADHLVEIGPGRGEAGGSLVYSGPLEPILSGSTRTLTGDYLTGQKSLTPPPQRRAPRSWLQLRGASQHNLKHLDVDIPLGVLCCVSGVSGSGKSTLVNEVLYRHLAQLQGLELDEPPGACTDIRGAHEAGTVVLVDQSPLTRTPRSSPVVYLGVFDGIRELYARTPDALSAGMTPGTFSFNTGNGRCERCTGSGYEKIEMQFLSDVFVRCPECEGKRYQPFVRKIRIAGVSIDALLEMTITEGAAFLEGVSKPELAAPLRALEALGLGYLRLGQPLNGLSGGESQRLKLVERLLQKSEKRSFLILDEPTTGLHFDDIALLLSALQRLVEEGHSVLVIEHNLDVIRSADFVIDLGPEGGDAGGQLLACGTPEHIAQEPLSHTGRFLAATAPPLPLRVAEPSPAAAFPAAAEAIHAPQAILVHGARHHNLKNLNVQIPREAMVVITGLSGSGKSTLAFDLLFAEGQRRFLDSMSPYARQFATQLERPDVDRVAGLPPTVAIEQRITRGGGKSTVATVTEAYHFLRLLFAKLGTQHCPDCGLPVEKQSLSSALERLKVLCENGPLKMLAPLVRARKGFHKEVSAWARFRGFSELLVDGKWVQSDAFPKLERFQEHTIEVLVGSVSSRNPQEHEALLHTAFSLGSGTATLINARGKRRVLSLERCCSECGHSFEELDPRLFSFNSPHGWCAQCHGFGEVWTPQVNARLESALEIELDLERQHASLDHEPLHPCPACNGSRLNPLARCVTLHGKSIDQVVSQTPADFLPWLQSLHFEGAAQEIARDILPEIEQRLRFLSRVGLNYLALNRSARTLSGGESQRIRLAAQLGSNLQGVLYVLDEPTIGLHPRDNEALLDTLEGLKKRGNSLILVEHDESTLLRADHILDLGPGAGRHGGEIVAQGSLEDIRSSERSATGACLRHPLQHPIRGQRRALPKPAAWLELKAASLHNLQSLDVRIPLARLSVLTGISGSGKSTLMRGILIPAVQSTLRSAESPKKAGTRTSAKARPPRVPEKSFRSIRGAQHLEAVYEVDQSPIGKTSRSTPATYLGIFDAIRALFASAPLARVRGYEPSRFSFNTEGGRCETCLGQGSVKLEMNFLPSVHVPCDACGGRRYHPTTLEVLYQGKSIADVLEMPIEVAATFFANHRAIARTLRLLCDTGLGYLSLGQPSQTLSGGEAQRLKLVSELARGVGRSEEKTLRGAKANRSILYCLEEPTIGLHQADVRLLLEVLHRLVDQGHTVVVIEHHTAVIAEADFLLEMGPEAGAAGGKLIAAGTPEDILHISESCIAPYLRDLLRTEAAPLPKP